MTMLNQYYSKDQDQKHLQQLGAVETEADRSTDLERDGIWDGKMGSAPDENKWMLEPYRSGYITGIIYHYDKKYQIEVETAF